MAGARVVKALANTDGVLRAESAPSASAKSRPEKWSRTPPRTELREKETPSRARAKEEHRDHCRAPPRREPTGHTEEGLRVAFRADTSTPCAARGLEKGWNSEASQEEEEEEEDEERRCQASKASKRWNKPVHPHASQVEHQ